MINLPFRGAFWRGRFRRLAYRLCLNSISRRPIEPPAALDCALVAFSGQRDLPEQVASLRSFLRHVGSPRSILIMSDGTHSEADKTLLRKLHPHLGVRPWTELAGPELPECVHRYAGQHAFGKKLIVFMSMAVSGPAIYADSDILFFPGAAHLRGLMEKPVSQPSYLLDCWPSFDERLIRSAAEKEQPVNGGFAILRGPLDWREPLERFQAMNGEGEFFTEQTLVHLAMRQAGGQPLPPEKYVLANDDQWIYADRHCGPGVALRHYISSLRHKFWNQVQFP